MGNQRNAIPALLCLMLIAFLFRHPLCGQSSSCVDIQYGFHVNNMFLNGSYRSVQRDDLLGGVLVNPTCRIEAKLSQHISISANYSSGIYFAQNPLVGQGWLQSIRQSANVSAFWSFDNRSVGIGLSFVDHKFWNSFNPILPRNDLVDHFGPSIYYRVKFDYNYQLIVGYDITYDFIQDEFSYFSDFVNISLYKSLVASKPKGKAENYDVSIALGLETSYNHNHRFYQTMPLTQKHLFAELEFWPFNQWSVFLKRSFWVDLELRTLTGQSEYIQTNNLGVKYSSKGLHHRFGVSHFMSNESLYDEIAYFRDSVFQEGIFKYHGASLSYERRLINNFYLSTQVDMIFGSPIFETWHERVRPRVGLKYLF